jgi:hypothetical protein
MLSSPEPLAEEVIPLISAVLSFLDSERAHGSAHEKTRRAHQRLERAVDRFMAPAHVAPRLEVLK